MDTTTFRYHPSCLRRVGVLPLVEMTEGDVGLVPLPQADGVLKLRPAILLRAMPPFGDWLICGVSSQLRQQVVGFDELIEPARHGFVSSGLKIASLIRLGFLTTLPSRNFSGKIGAISSERHARSLGRLTRFIAQSGGPTLRCTAIAQAHFVSLCLPSAA